MSNPKAAAPTLVRITNNTDAGIDLPPVPETANAKGFPVRCLIPGGNNVPTELINAIVSYETIDRFGNKRKPHEGLFDKLEADGKIVISTDPRATKRKEGPEPPKSLASVPEAIALEFVLDCADLGLLGQWRKLEKRTPVINALDDRIARLS